MTPRPAVPLSGESSRRAVVEATRVLGPRLPLYTPSINLADTPEPRLPQLDGYELLGELGRGGMGVVYKARQASLNRIVALKMVLGGSFADKDALARFRLEAEAVARLQHPAIVQIFEVGIRHGAGTDGFYAPFIALEFVEGGNLARSLCGQPQPPRECARMVETLARAVHYAHELGIVHRDLKPANVLLTASGAPKLTDFGLAKDLGGTAAAMTMTGMAMGTPEYMSPEQVAGRPDVGPAADIYALGVILYEMLTGRRPFEGEAGMTVLDAVLREPPRPPRRLRPQLPHDIEVICLKCLSKEPERRYASAAALADDLARFRADEPIVARPQGSAECLARWCRRKPVLAGMTAALIAVVLLGFAGVTAMWLIADSRGRLAEERGQLAEDKSREAREALDGEAVARAEGQLHIARLDGVTANKLLEDGDLLAALPWLVEMLQLEEQGYARQPEEWKVRERVHRARLAAVLRQCPRPLQVWTHDRPLRAAFFSSDGKKIFTAEHAAPIRAWDVDSGEPALTLPAAINDVTKFAFAPGLLATGEDLGVTLFDSASGNAIGEKIKFNRIVRHIALSPDGKRLMVGYSDLLEVRELPSRQILWSAQLASGDGGAGIAALAFTPDGKRVVAAPALASPELRDAETGKVLTTLKGTTGSVASLCFSPNGRRLATSDGDGAKLWDAETGTPSHKLMHGAGVLHACFSPDGRFLVTAGGDGIARIWDVETGSVSLITFRHASRIVRVEFSPDGRRLLTASHDGTARLWDAATGRALLTPLRHARPLITAAFHPDGDRVMTAGDDGVVRLWDATDATHLAVPLRHAAPVRGSAFDRSGDQIATAAEDGTVRVWNKAGEPTSPLLHQPERLVQVNFHPNGRVLVTAGSSRRNGIEIGVAQTWDLDRAARGDLQLVVGAGKVAMAEYTRDGTRILLNGPYAANLWDVALKRDVVSVNQGNFLRHSAISPDGTRVALAMHIGFGCWESVGRTEYRAEHSDIACITFDPTGRRLAVAGDNHNAGIFDAATSHPLTPPLGHDGPVKHVAFSPDGRVLVSCSDDRTARLWDADTGRPLVSPLQHPGKVIVAAFSASGREVLTVCNISTNHGTEGRARWWDVATGEPLTPPLLHPGAVYHAAASPGAGLMVTACATGGGWLWPTATPDARPIQALRKHAELLSGQRLDTRLGPVALTNEAFEANWRDVRSKSPAEFRRSADRIAAWRLSEVGECEAAGHWFGAAWHLDRLLAAKPGDWKLHARRSHIHLLAGSPELAAARLADAAKLGPQREVEAWVNDQATQTTVSQKWPAAQWYLDRLVTARPDDGTLYARRAIVRGHLGNVKGRIADLEKAVVLGTTGDVAIQLAELMGADGDWPKAVRLYALAAERGAPDWMAWARASVKANDRDGYRRVCKAYLALATTDKARPELANNAAWVCVLGRAGLDDYSVAIKLAERAVTEGPDEGRAGSLNTLGAVLYRAGKHREAIARLQEGVKLGGGGTEDWIFLGLAHHALGEAAEAKRYLEKLRSTPRPGATADAGSRIEDELLREELEQSLGVPGK